MAEVNSYNISMKNITKESITQALLLLMDKKEYTAITISEICVRAGVSRNAFYRNYPAKDAILRIFTYEVTQSWRIEYRKSNRNLTAEDYFSYLFTQIGKYKSLIKKMLLAGLDYLIIDLFFNFFRDFTKNSNFPTYHTCHLGGSIYAIVVHWVMNEQPETPEELASIVCKLNHIKPDGICTPPGVNDITDIDTMLTRSTFTYRN